MTRLLHLPKDIKQQTPYLVTDWMPYEGVEGHLSQFRRITDTLDNWLRQPHTTWPCDF